MSYILHNAIRPNMPLDTTLSDLFRATIQTGTLDSLAVIVPTGRRSRLLKREVIHTAFKVFHKPVENLSIFTLESFVRLCSVSLMRERCPRTISEPYRFALFEEAANNAELNFFRGKKGSLSAAALERLANVVFGLKEDGVTVHALRGDIANAELSAETDVTDLPRLRDIAALYEEYEKLLVESLADYPRILRLTTDIISGKIDRKTFALSVIPDDESARIAERWREILPNIRTLVLDGFSEFKTPEAEFLGLLSKAPFHTRISLDYSPENGPLFGNLDETLRQLAFAGFTPVALDDTPESRPDYRQEHHAPLDSYLRRWLFNTEKEIFHNGFDTMATIIGAENRLEEVRAIAKYIKKIGIKDGVDVSEICVVMRQPNRYTGLFREIFAEYDIPANITDRFALEKSPLVVAVFSALDAVFGGFHRSDVHRALQSPYLRFERMENGKKIPLDAANLYNVALKLRIVGGTKKKGAEHWFFRLKKRDEYLDRQMRILAKEEFADEEEKRVLRSESEKVKLALKDFSAFVELLPVFDERSSASEFSQTLKMGILKNLGVFDRVNEFYADAKRYVAEEKSKSDNAFVSFRVLELLEEAEKDGRALTALLRLCDEMTFIFEERFPHKKRATQEFAERLQTAVRAEKYQVREKFGFGVTVTTLEQIRNTPFAVTILCGAVDGEFPARYVPESFLGKELPDAENRFLKRERLQFYQAITNNPAAFQNGTKRLVITYPIFNGNEELVRSSFVDALLKVSSLEKNGNILTLSAIRLGKESAGEFSWIDLPASKEEFLREAGKHLVSGWGIEHLPEFPESEMLKMRLEKAKDLPKIGIKPELLVANARKRLNDIAENPISVSALEIFAACPFKFFSKRVVSLPERDEFDVKLSPLESGNFLHKILFRFYRNLQNAAQKNETVRIIPSKNSSVPPLIPVRLEPKRREEYRKQLQDIAEEEIAAIRFEHPFFEIDKEDLLGSERKKGKIGVWLDEELGRVANGWLTTPALFEFGFGDRSALGAGVPPIRLGATLQLRGKIDRVEILLQENGENVEFLIADYKSGKVKNLVGNRDIERGESLQMPLYIAAMTVILEQNYGLLPQELGAVYYSLSPKFDAKKKNLDSIKFVLLPKNSAFSQHLGLQSSRSQVVPDEESTRYMVRHSIEKSEEYLHNITEGAFVVRPAKAETCERCSYQAVCRIAEQTKQPDSEKIEDENEE